MMRRVADAVRWVSLLWTDPPFAWAHWMMRLADALDPDVPSDINDYTVVSNDNEGDGG